MLRHIDFHLYNGSDVSLQETPIQIGLIGLQGFEVPSSVRFGGRYRLAVHTLSGGRRAVERLGPDDGEIAFRGTFSGSNAEARVRAFDELRISGEIVWLTWESFRRLVIVKSFIAEYKSPWWIPYQVSCVVVHQSGVGAAQISTLSSLIMADLANALSATSGSTLSLDSLQSALASTNVLTAGTSDQAKAMSAVTSTIGQINSQVSVQSSLITTNTASCSNSLLFAQTLTSTVANAGLLASAANAAAYVGRIGTNLISSGG